MATTWIDAVVTDRTMTTLRVVVLDLQPIDGNAFPEHEAGAAGPMAVETARRKTYISAVSGFGTAAFAQFAAGPAMTVAPPHLIDPYLLPVPGGVPIVVDESEVMGADGETDDCIAVTAVKSIADLLA
jgi:uncharacterized protein GlcG (DUF336 family)